MMGLVTVWNVRVEFGINFGVEFVMCESISVV